MKNLSRRRFIKVSASALAAPYVITSSALGNTATAPASERITVAFIGNGIRANGILPKFLNLADAQVIAACDVCASRRQQMKKRIEDFYSAKSKRNDFNGCHIYNDYREILARRDIDAVAICTPDHWHAIMTIEAAKAGKDIFVEKPMDISVTEGRAICDAIKKYKRIFQHGTQQRSAKNFRFACQLVRNQKIGKLQRIIVASPPSVPGPVVEPMPVPKDLDYNMWIGPAPFKPYTEIRCKKGGWYHICDYTIGGFIGGWGIHHIDIAQWANNTDLTGPIEIIGSGIVPESGIYDAPTSFIFKLRYENGTEVIFIDDKQQAHGVRFDGDQGSVFVKRGAIDAQPKSLLECKIGPNEVNLYKSDHHFQNFIQCIKSRKQTICPAEASHRSTTICSLAHIAMITGNLLKWNPVKERFTNNKQANTMLTRPTRDIPLPNLKS
ncbi:MAG: Gfo/Idh/MocA family protein [Planctomycetota bacterium]